MVGCNKLKIYGRGVFLTMFLLLTHTLPAQTYQVESIQSEGNTAIDVLHVLEDGAIAIAGQFQEQISLQDTSLTAFGQEDVFLSIYKNGEYTFTQQIGGHLADKITGVSSFGQHITAFGEYSIQAILDNDTLATTLSSKGLFLAQYHSNGNLLWTQSIDANILSNSGEVATDSEGNIIITGYFYDTLLIQQNTLIANSTEGDMFVAKFSDTGNLLWAKNAGNTGVFRANSLQIDQEDNIIIAGKFKGSGTFGTTTLQTNTADSDVFIAKMNPNGAFLWAKKIGGVLEDNLTAIVIDEQNYIYATGYFIGVLSSAEDDWSTQTSGINNNVFLMRLTPNGSLVWAKNIGETQEDYSTDITIWNDKIALSGYFQEQTNWGVNTLTSQGGTDAIVAIFDTTGQALNHVHISGENLEIIQQVAYLSSGSLVFGGTFNGTCTLDNYNLSSMGVFDAFWAVASPLVAVEEVEKPPFSFYPNPCDDVLFLNSQETVFLYNTLGKLVIKSKHHTVNTRQIPSGIYWLITTTHSSFQKLIIQH